MIFLTKSSSVWLRIILKNNDVLLCVVCDAGYPILGHTILIIITNFHSPVSDTRCHSRGPKMRIARIKIRVDSPGR